MADDLKLTTEATRQEVAEIVANFKDGASIDGLTMVASAAQVDAFVASGALITKPLILGDDLLFVQPDGTIIGLLDGAKAEYALRADELTIPSESLVAVAMQQDGWQSVGDAVEVSLVVLSTTVPPRPGGSSEQARVLPGDPLIGLDISPLLPPTEYQFPEFFDRDVGEDGIGEAEIVFGGEGSVSLVETDGPVVLSFADFIEISAGGAEDGEEITGVTVTLPGLPIGTTATAGSFVTNGTTQTFTFTGTLEAFNALQIVLPTDFSTESRTDATPGPLTGTLVVTSNFAGEETFQFPVNVDFEGDLEFVGTGAAVQAETDDPVDFVLFETLTPRASDLDGSESVVSVLLELTGLPLRTLVSTDGGNTFGPILPGPYSFAGSLAEYEQLVVRLPADFSTTNPATSITGTLRATTDEGADEVGTFQLVVEDTPDIVIDPPMDIVAEEDANVVGGGVTVDFGLNVFVTDADGSEDDTVVQIAFTDLPPLSVFSTGLFVPATSTWTGTMAQANLLQVDLPADYSGVFTSVITGINVEGTAAETQMVTVLPTGDVDISAPPIVSEETDAALAIRLSDTWDISVDDADGSETLDRVLFSIEGLPRGMIIRNVPDSSFTYNEAAGTLTFDGTGPQFELLTLVFPKDYSTVSPLLNNGDPTREGYLVGQLQAVSNEGSAGPQEVLLRITPEGDAIVSVLPFEDLDELEATQQFVLGNLLDPMAIDEDMSESIEVLDLVITGLPSIAFDASDIQGLPADFDLSVDSDGSQTLTARFSTSEFADVAAAFSAVTVTLPIDFSTRNRSDVDPNQLTSPPASDAAVELPITVTARITTDEDAPGIADDNEATGQAIVNVDFDHDIQLNVPPFIEAEEDEGVINGDQGVFVPLGLQITINDDDGSETETAGNRFSARVTIEFDELPGGAAVTEGTLNGLNWSGSVQEARDLQVFYPGNYSGFTFAQVTVTTLEGFVSQPQVIVVTPTPDVLIEGNIISEETDDELPLLISDFLTIPPPLDPDETLVSLTFELPGLPDGTLAVENYDPSDPDRGTPVGSFTPDGGGTSTFFFDTQAEPTVDPAAITLVFPQDFSTENPLMPLQATVSVRSQQTGFPVSDPVTSLVDVLIDVEGDVRIDVNTQAPLQETDAPVEFKPSDYLTPLPIDLDGSEALAEISVTFNALPALTEFSTDGINFNFAPATLNFIGDIDEYNALTIRLPADFSTVSPPSTLTGTVIATTDEFGAAEETFSVVINPEGDLRLIGDGTLTLDENDPPGVVDLDDTTATPTPQDPVEFRLSNVVSASADEDDDSSESIVRIDVDLSDLPAGTLISVNGGLTFPTTFPAGGYTQSFTSLADYQNLVIRLPDDFSTQRAEGAITGSVAFQTDESIANGETLNDAGGGWLSQNVEIDVLPEGDVRITGDNIEVIEDLGTPIDLGLSSEIVDVDGSEEFQALTITFTGLPGNGPTRLSDGTELTATNNVWTGTDLTDLNGLSIVSFPEHFSGGITFETNVVTDETGPAGQSASFNLNVTPVAEPVITLTVDASEPAVTEISPAPLDQFSVKEDSSFLLLIDAMTPDQDGSEQLTQIVIDNMPAGWLRNGDGALDLSLFETGGSAVSSAEVTGTTLTIVLNADVTNFDGALRVTPTPDSDEDVSTLDPVGLDLIATVTSVDTADTLSPLPAQSTDTVAAQDGVDVDLDAVVDDIDFTSRDRTNSERLNRFRQIDAGLTQLALQDTDGSETLDSVRFTITVDTLSTNYDAADDDQLQLNFRQIGGNVDVTKIDTVPGDNVVEYVLTRPDGVSSADFASAITTMRVFFPQHFSGRATLDGEVSWSETQTGDAEADASDNVGTEAFSHRLTVRPRAEAELDAGVFVTNPDFVTDDSPEAVGSSVTSTNGNNTSDQSVVDDETLTLQESTADGSGFGQVQAFLRLSASTPDLDGSEELTTLVVSNLPSSWIGVDETTDDVILSASMFFALDGSGSIDPAEFAKIDSAAYSAATGELTLSFVPGVTSFDGAVAIYPALYEDYDVDRAINGDPFSADGDFFGADLNVALTTTDGNTVTTSDRTVDATFDVDVDPINNTAFVLSFPQGNEQVVDDAGGILQFAFLPLIEDTDGSETIVSAVIRDVPAGITVYARPVGGNILTPKEPALITEVNPDGTLDWSLDTDQWLTLEFRGIPTHFAGQFPIQIDIVTREANGGTGTTTLDVDVVVDPVADGGNPSETTSTFEDQAVLIQIDGNIIDQTPESRERILEDIEIFNVQPDSEGRLPRFFDGQPIQNGVTPGGDPTFSNEISPTVGDVYLIGAAVAPNLHVLPGQDSNEDISFNVRVIYTEVIDPSEFTTGAGTVLINVTGVADDPIVEVQEADPDLTTGGIDKDSINVVYRPDEFTDMVINEDRAYAYAGFDNRAIPLIQRVSDEALRDGFDVNDGDANFVAADPLSGERTEILFPDGQPDGSETVYYIISDIPPELTFIGGSPIDTSGESYLVPGPNLPGVAVQSQGVTEVTYYDLTFNTIVVEDDFDLATVDGPSATRTFQQVLQDLDAEAGASVGQEQFSVMVLPAFGGGGDVCPPDDPRLLPIPQLKIPDGTEFFEDEANEFQLMIVAEGPWTSIGDLTNLPEGVNGDFGFGLTLPPGGSLSSQPPGGVLFDPITGQYAIDFAVLGQDPNDPTMTEGVLIYTPPLHESSPENPFFDPVTGLDETLGDQDPYDNLPVIETTSVLNNFTCNVFTNETNTLSPFITPVADGPSISIGAPTNGVLEDNLIDLNIQITSVDGGERLIGDVVINLSDDPGAQLGRGTDPSNFVPIDPDPGTDGQYTLSVNDLAGLSVRATEHYSGNLTVAVTATTQDINNETSQGTATQVVPIEPVADEPVFIYNPNPIDTDNGFPLVDTSGPIPIVSAVEDQEFLLREVLIRARSPDQDGSEIEAAVIGPIPDYLEITGTNTGVIDNGDRTFTVSRADIPTLGLRLRDEHARTPDELDAEILAEIPVTITINTLELANADEATGSTTFILRVYPDADKPTISASIDPGDGIEDSGQRYTIDLSGDTVDPHETIDFELTLPPGSRFFIGNTEQTVPANGIVTVAGVEAQSSILPVGKTFVPSDDLSFIPPENFGGDVSIDAVAITTDVSTTYSFTDTERSDAAELNLAITPSGDLEITVPTDPVEVPETDADVTLAPKDFAVLDVTDNIPNSDGSEEMVSAVTVQIDDVPEGTTYTTLGVTTPVAGTNLLIENLSEDQYDDLVITFPADYSTNGILPGDDALLEVVVSARTNEFAAGDPDVTASFELSVPGEEDLSVTVPSEIFVAETDEAELTIALNIAASVTDTQTTPSETLENTVVTFSSALPDGSRPANQGTLSADRTTLTFARGSLTPDAYAMAITMLGVIVPGTFATSLLGNTVEVTTSHSDTDTNALGPVAFDVVVNERPEITGPVDLPETFDTSTVYTFTQLLANATDAQATTIDGASVSSPDNDVQVSVVGEDVTVTVPAGYVGTPVLNYDVVDAGTPPATSAATANLDIDTLQMQDSGVTDIGPDGITRAVMTDVGGDAALGGTTAKGTSGGDAVLYNAGSSPYADIAEFDMMGGSDLVDLTGATAGYSVLLGAGEDVAIGSSGNDLLEGGADQDTLTGGDGADIFVLSSGPVTIEDFITDYNLAEGDRIDLTAVVNGIDDITGIVEYDPNTGNLDVSGSTAFNVENAPMSMPIQVEVIFEDSMGAAQTALV